MKRKEIRTLKLSNNSSEMVADQTRSKFARDYQIVCRYVDCLHHLQKLH